MASQKVLHLPIAIPRTVITPDLCREIRIQLALSQKKFSEIFDIPLHSIRNWEQGRSLPDAVGIIFLLLIQHDPNEVARLVNLSQMSVVANDDNEICPEVAWWKIK